MSNIIKDIIKAPFRGIAIASYKRSLKHVSKQVKAFQDFSGKPEGPVNVVPFSKIGQGLSIDSTAKITVFAEDPSMIVPGALKKIEGYFAANPDAKLLYGDSGFDLEASATWFYRPNWSPHYFLYSFYTGGLFAVRTEALEGLEPAFAYTGDALTDAMKLFYTAGLKYGAFSKEPACPVGHIPFILYREDFEKERARYKEAASKFFELVKPDPGEPLVSSLILSKDHPDVVKTCIETMDKARDGVRLETILVDNGSNDENRAILEKYCAEKNIRYIYEKCDFNFSKLCNLAASHATGDYYLFCNDDIEFEEHDTLYKLVECAAFDFCGEAGLKLLYPKVNKIQHAGVVNVIAGPTHKYQYCDDATEYYFGINRNVINTVCATAACVMMKKERFEEVGGFPENLAVAFNDVALGFALCRKGYYNACRNDIHAIHCESLTRGYDYEDEAKLKRLMAEHDKLYSMFPEYENGKDPYISPYASHTSGTESDNMPFFFDAVHISRASLKKTSKYDRFIADGREDKMLLRIFEHFEKESDMKEGGDPRVICLNGYSFVYKYDNIGLRTRIIFAGPGGTYELKPARIYRPDLMKDYPDETNIDFCGFEASFDTNGIAPGEYRIYFYIFDISSRLTQFRVAERTLVI